MEKNDYRVWSSVLAPLFATIRARRQADPENKFPTLALSLGGSQRPDGRGRNTAGHLLAKVREIKPFTADNPAAVMVLSEEKIHANLFKSDHFGEPAPLFYPVQAHVPENSDTVLEPRIPEIHLEGGKGLETRNVHIAGLSANIISMSGETDFNKSPLAHILYEVFRGYDDVFVHNDLWQNMPLFGCTNLYLEQTPCLLYALNMARVTGTNITFLKLPELSGCSGLLGFVPTDPHDDRAIWNATGDLKLYNPLLGGRRGKRRSRKTRRRTRRSHVRTKV